MHEREIYPYKSKEGGVYGDGEARRKRAADYFKRKTPAISALIMKDQHVSRAMEAKDPRTLLSK